MKRSVPCSLVILPAVVFLFGFRQNKVITLPIQEAVPEFTGSLTNPWWREGKIFATFATVSPSPGRKGSERSAGYILRDAENLYVGLRMDDRQMDALRADAGTGDKLDADDWAGISIQPSADSTSAICFMVNPRGIRENATIDASGTRHMVAAKKWTVKTRKSPTGWTAELQIPVAQIPLDSKKENIIGIQFLRHIARTNVEVQGPVTSQSGRPSPADYQKLLLPPP